MAPPAGSLIKNTVAGKLKNNDTTGESQEALFHNTKDDVTPTN